MRNAGCWIGAVVLSLVFGSRSFAQAAGWNLFDPPATGFDPTDLRTWVYADPGINPLMMAVPANPPSVYAPIEPPKPEDGLNQGGLNVDLDFKYLTDDVYRGVSHNRAVYVPATATTAADGKLHASNFQPDARLTFDLGPLPHPYVGVLANLNDSDPLSRFQEIRPFAGASYNLRPMLVDFGVNAYIYPERERFNPSPNTAEVYIKLTLDDSFFFLTPKPILAPYIYGAYDYQRNQGWYLETGVRHDFDFPDFGVTLTPYADVAFISHFEQQFISIDPHKSGFQHYDVGLIADYSLNHLLHVGSRYGQFTIEGYLTYTGRFSNELLAVNELWGGVGLRYRY